jgi:hypothetical protein
VKSSFIQRDEKKNFFLCVFVFSLFRDIMTPLGLRLCISGAVAFLLGLVFALPPVHFNQSLFPNTRAMYTLHIEATQNGIMLVVMAFLSDICSFSPLLALILEFAAHTAAWMNIIPWLYIGFNGIVFDLRPGSVSMFSIGQAALNLKPLANNAELSANVALMLGACGVGAILSWSILLYGLLKVYFRSPKANKQK